MHDLPDSKALSKLLDVLKKQGVVHFRCGDMEVVFETPTPPVFSSSNTWSTSPDGDGQEDVWRGYTTQDLLGS